MVLGHLGNARNRADVDDARGEPLLGQSGLAQKRQSSNSAEVGADDIRPVNILPDVEVVFPKLFRDGFS